MDFQFGKKFEGGRSVVLDFELVKKLRKIGPQAPRLHAIFNLLQMKLRGGEDLAGVAFLHGDAVTQLLSQNIGGDLYVSLHGIGALLRSTGPAEGPWSTVKIVDAWDAEWLDPVGCPPPPHGPKPPARVEGREISSLNEYALAEMAVDRFLDRSKVPTIFVFSQGGGSSGGVFLQS